MSKSFEQWLAWMEQCHPSEIDLNLIRPQAVLQRLIAPHTPATTRLLSGTVPREIYFRCPVITVAGTNGKGSTIAVLEALAKVSKLSTLVYTSPHLIDYRERVTYNGEWISKEQHVAAFEAVDKARMTDNLTYFEYATLAMFKLADELQPDLLILETGLGGRLDAVNLIAADIAIITTIDYDHQDWLGNTLLQIAREKTGIIHENKQVVIADENFPIEILNEVKNITPHVYQAGAEYQCLLLGKNSNQNQTDDNHWRYCSNDNDSDDNIQWKLDLLSFPEMNAAAAIYAFSLLPFKIKMSEELVQHALLKMHLVARFESVGSKPQVILDVAHNAQAFRTQANLLTTTLHQGKTRIILGMLKDKNINDCIDAVLSNIDQWSICDLDSPRAIPAADLCTTVKFALENSTVTKDDIQCYHSPLEAFKEACESASENDRIIVTGSFYTVAPVLKYLRDKQDNSPEKRLK